MTRDEVIKTLKTIFDREGIEVPSFSTKLEYLGVDSLKAVEITMCIEDAFIITISDDEMIDHMETVEGIIELVMSKF